MSGTPLSVRNPFLLRSFFSLPPSTSFFPCIESIRPCEPLSYRQPALERSTRGSFHFLPPSSSFPPRVRAKYLHVNVGHGAISTADIHRRIYVARNVWKRSVIEKRYTRERTHTVPRYITLRYVSTRFDRAAFRSNRSNLRAGPSSSNGRVEFACETNRYFIQTACSLPVILSPYRSNLRRLLPFSVSPLFPCRTPNSLSRHDKTPPRTRPERIVHECYFPPIISISSPVFSFPSIKESFHSRISSVSARGQIGGKTHRMKGCSRCNR